MCNYMGSPQRSARDTQGSLRVEERRANGARLETAVTSVRNRPDPDPDPDPYYACEARHQVSYSMGLS
jgi:hypothetical protein